MSLLSRILSPRAGSTDPNSSDFWFGYATSGETYSGISLTGDTALKTSAVYACIRVRAEMLATVPIMLYRRGPGGERERATDHPLYHVLHDAPNRWQTPFEFRQLMQAWVDFRGNAYAYIASDGTSPVSELLPMHPDRMTIRLLDDGTLRYDYARRSGDILKLLPYEVFHLRGFTFDGYTGVTPITYAADAIGRQLAMERANARFHKNDGSPRVAIKHPGTLKSDAHDRLRASWDSAYAGYANAHKAAILEEGMEIQVIGLKPEDAQFIESWEGGITDICRWYGVHPRKLYAKSGDSQTYSNVESAGIEHLTDTGLPIFNRFEQAVDRDLLTSTERGTYHAEFLVEALLRADSASRAAFYASALTGGWMTRNEVRERENLPPMEGGDVIERPAAAPAPFQRGGRDQQPDQEDQP